MAEYSILISLTKALAANDKVERRRGYRNLRDFIENSSEELWLDEKNLLKLWKGIHYTLWMADKYQIHVYISEKFTELSNSFKNSQVALQYLKAGLETLNKEWSGIDSRRIDKYYMFLTSVFRSLILHMITEYYDKKYIRNFLGSEDFCAGIRLHFLDKYVDILKEGLARKVVRDKVKSNVELAVYPCISGLYTHNKVVFKRTLESFHNFLKEIESSEILSSSVRDLAEVEKLLFECAKDKEMPQKNRVAVFDLRAKVEALSKKGDTDMESKKRRKVV